jgi:hypothetical protein
VLNQLQDIAAAVAQRHEPRIERGHRKADRLAAGAKPSEAVNRSVRQLHQELPVELEALNQRIEASRDRLAKNARLAKEATLKAERLADNTAKSDAARNNAEIYLRRAVGTSMTGRDQNVVFGSHRAPSAIRLHL